MHVHARRSLSLIPILLLATLWSVGCAEEAGDIAFAGALQSDCDCDEEPIPFVSPSVIDFGPVKTGEEATVPVTIANVGDGVLIVDQALFQGSPEFRFLDPENADPDDEASFIQWAPPLVLGPMTSTTFLARYRPVANVSVSGRLVLQTNSRVGTEAPAVWVAGVGVPECPVAVQQELGFGHPPHGVVVMERVDLVGCDSGLRVLGVALTADSSAAYGLDLTGLGLAPGEVPTAEAPVMIQPGQGASFIVTFEPSGTNGQVDYGTVEITASIADVPILVELTGVAGTPSPLQ